ncbi:Ragulator complex protein LAMTOR1 [Geodia barretti]|uniref:Ragulator complex protein LAMTOR1 n=1 Tax=Geodia barretti TaxID=519541 RepID=A0AA35R6Z6_GEOBA|nr:Ragulator complex protein LAMTOR1 [Geodia barretti]
MGCFQSCMSKDEPDSQGPTETSRLLPEPTQPIPTMSDSSKTDEESALNRVLQKTANDVIDVTYIEPHSMENAEVSGRTREYRSQVASLRGVSRPVAKLPPNNQPPAVMLSKELVSPADVRFVTDRSEATAAAVESMEVKHGEPLVVQFAAP